MQEDFSPTAPSSTAPSAHDAGPSRSVANDYGEAQIKVLEGIEHVRTRPGMYIGDTTPRGLHHLVYEIVDNSIDEAGAGYCKSILVKINADGSCTVAEASPAPATRRRFIEAGLPAVTA